MIYPEHTWFANGFGLTVLDGIKKRIGKGWEDGVVHRGGIHSGTWLVYMPTRMGQRIAEMLSLYDSAESFIED